MNLKNILVSNYRSIEEMEVTIEDINGSQTYALLGINESGKSSFLQSLFLLENNEINYPLDYFDQSKEVFVQLEYQFTKRELTHLHKVLEEEKGFPKDLVNLIDITKIFIIVDFEPNPTHSKRKYAVAEFTQNEASDYTLIDGIPKLKPDDGQYENFSIEKYFMNFMSEYFIDLSHRVVFWRSSKEFLILEEIDLNSFATNPIQVSIPLLNCFRLADINLQILQSTISELNNAISINNLQERLSDVVTNHINQIWPEHPIRIKFQISSNKISLLIKDEGVQYSVKTTSQRSDGFRQFISFLLTLSVENQNRHLSNTLLLIDEPEVHLHPPAQLNLLHELIEITKNKRNNIVFFATHSNYLIDKKNLDRCYKVSKHQNQITKIEKIERTKSSYAEVNYEVFNIATTDYHNELYGYLEDIDPLKLNSLKKDKIWINAKNGKSENVSLSRYIRHSIHHPENNLNREYTEKQLRKSIEMLRSLKYE